MPGREAPEQAVTQLLAEAGLFTATFRSAVPKLINFDEVKDDFH